MSLRPVNQEKHETTWSNLGQNASTVQTITLINAIRAPLVGNDVNIGSIIKWIYLETNLNGVDNSGVVQVFHWNIIKSPNNSLPINDPATYDTPQKKWIVKRGMEMLPEIPLDSGGTVQTKRVFVIKIPKKMQRFGDSDKLLLNYKSTSASGINYCGIAIFKELR